MTPPTTFVGTFTSFGGVAAQPLEHLLHDGARRIQLAFRASSVDSRPGWLAVLAQRPVAVIPTVRAAARGISRALDARSATRGGVS